ncbi:DedA family protein [Legionella lansingensis]|uniref:DedA family protein n=1 Tax=Legionella lansingensis TaxID=45067 RepID=A0A0W0VXK1_9GAMM|nr:DedA family protein [Legionella lansingensis]KTD24755.1 DedA family protein [Legionella lansingensis]SNV48817.1 DedA family protein [Legionella lansingensis]
MEQLHLICNTILHLDSYLFSFVSQYGAWTYLVLFLIIFCETGLVILPFLPGDSLLFASGSIAAQSSASLDIVLLFTLLVIASIIGNQLNYFFGRVIGPQVFTSDKSRFLNKKYLMKTHHFYEKHGGKTIIFARFIPIIRTFAPFIAGIGYMKRSHFFLYNIASATLWIGSLLFLGYFVGGLPFIKNNFTLVIYGIIVLSLLPPILTFLYRKLARAQKN